MKWIGWTLFVLACLWASSKCQRNSAMNRLTFLTVCLWIYVEVFIAALVIFNYQVHAQKSQTPVPLAREARAALHRQGTRHRR